MGVGRGNRPAEFRGYHVPQQENRERFDEAVDILLKAWTEERFSLRGALLHHRRGARDPQAAGSGPHPPHLPGVRQRRRHRELGRARLAHAELAAHRAGRPARATARQLRDRARKHGRTEAEIATLIRDWGVSRQIYVADTDAQALAEAKDAEMWYQDSLRTLPGPGAHRGRAPELQPGFRAAAERFKKVTWEELVAETVAFGSPDTVARHIQTMRDMGVGPRALLDELRRPAPGPGPPLDGALRPRGHAALPRLTRRGAILFGDMAYNAWFQCINGCPGSSTSAR